MKKTTTPDTDTLVLQLLQTVEEKKKQIGNAERPSWKTNCSFGFDSHNPNNRINIQTIRDLDVLVTIHAHLNSLYLNYQRSLGDLNIDESEAPFVYLGYSLDDWLSDVQTRINALRIKLKKEELTKLEARVNALVSPEQRREIELKQLMEDLKISGVNS